MKRFCFTLIELLVVIAITALFIAILLPALRNSREQAKTVLCGSNIKQLLFGLLNYEAENQTLPYSFCVKLDTDGKPIKPPGGYAGGPAYGWWWFNFIEGFYRKSDGNKTVILCPSKRLNNPTLKNDILCSNYGVNRSICKSFDDWQKHREEFIGTPLRSIDIPHPAQTLLIVDSGYSIISWWHAADEPPVVLGNSPIEDTAYVPGLKINSERNLRPGQEEDAINGRHPNKTVNVGFTDGHLERVKADDLLVEKTGDDYKNKIPLWVPK